MTGIENKPAVSQALLTKRQLAELLTCSETSVDRMRRLGDLGPSPFKLSKPSGAWRWHRAEVEAWIEHRAADGSLYDAKTWPGVWAKLKGGRK
jgi:predicted DNA-binding transcriptional regulator AlpA